MSKTNPPEIDFVIPWVDGNDPAWLEERSHYRCETGDARRGLLRKHPFAEALGMGGEDIEVAYRIIKDGYKIAKVPDLLVMHSHGKPFFGFVKEYLGWKRMWYDVLAYIQQSE